MLHSRRRRDKRFNRGRHASEQIPENALMWDDEAVDWGGETVTWDESLLFDGESVMYGDDTVLWV